MIGLAIGSFAAYVRLEELRRIQAQHDRFQKMMASPAMSRFQKTVADVQRTLSTTPGDRFDQISAAMNKAEVNGTHLNFKHDGRFKKAGDLKTMLADPQFLNLSRIEKIRFLNYIPPDYILVTNLMGSSIDRAAADLAGESPSIQIELLSGEEIRETRLQDGPDMLVR